MGATARGVVLRQAQHDAIVAVDAPSAPKRPMIFLAQTLLFMLAVGGIVACSLGFIFFAGGAMNKARPPAMRRRRMLLAALCACGIVASAVLGFVGVPTILYLAQQ